MKYLNSAQRLSQKTMELTYVLIDFSGSMFCDDYKPTRKDGAIEANIKLIETKAKLHPQDQVGIIGFGSNAQVIHRNVPVGEDGVNLCRYLRKNKLSLGGTDFNKTLKLAERCLLNDVSQNESSSIFSKLIGEFLFDPIDSNSRHIEKLNNKSNITDGSSCLPMADTTVEALRLVSQNVLSLLG